MPFQLQQSINIAFNSAPSIYAGAKAIWSTKLRVLTYTGYCIRLKRASDSAVAEFKADINGNLTTYISGVPTSYSTWIGSSSAVVVLWYDQTGNNKNLGTYSNKEPGYSPTNGVTFNGSTQYFETTNTNLNPNDFSIVSSCTNLNSGAYGALISSRNASGTLTGYTLYKLDGNGANKWDLMYGTGVSSWTDLSGVTATTSTRYKLGFCVKGTSSNYKIVNTSNSTTTTGSITTANSYSPSTGSTLRVGAGTTESTPSYYFYGYVNDLYVYGVSLSDAQLTSIYNTL